MNRPDNAEGRLKMRKGRRRKVRCVFASDNSKACLRCSGRGLHCVEQTYSDVHGNENQTLRDRVARLEALLKDAHGSQKVPGAGSHSGNRLSRAVAEGDSSEGDGEDVEIQRYSVQAPFRSFLDAPQPNPTHATVQLAPVENTTSTIFQSHTLNQRYQTHRDTAFKDKQTQSCEMLRSALPPYDEVVRVFRGKNSWWMHWREKTFGRANAPESLHDYAARVYPSERPEELGILVAAFSQSSAKSESRYLQVVEDVVIAHDKFAATLKGLECIILQTKCYLNFGQPRRAWLSLRRGLTLAQLMNLNRLHNLPGEAEAIWWSLYHVDRFISLLLGLPYSVQDAHLSPDEDTGQVRPSMYGQLFLLRCGKAVGRIIDRNHASREPAWSVTVSIEEEMEAIAALMPDYWWEIPSISEGTDPELGPIRIRILTQIYFFHVRMYLHLPFMRTPATDARYEYSRSLCVQAVRELVKRYLLLRTTILATGEDLLDCKINDFTAFTASVVLFMGLLQCKSDPAGLQSQNDWDLIHRVRKTFRRLIDEKFCKMLAQCDRALGLLVERPISHEPIEVFIPYFGTVTVAGGSEVRRDTDQRADIHSTAEMNDSKNSQKPEDFPTVDWTAHLSDDALLNDPTFGLSMPSFDIDDDWSQFLQ